MPDRAVSAYGLQLERIADELHQRVAGGATEDGARDALDIHERAAAVTLLGFSHAAVAVMTADMGRSVATMLAYQQSRDARVDPMVDQIVEITRQHVANRAAEIANRAAEIELERERIRLDDAQRRETVGFLGRLVDSKAAAAIVAALAGAASSGAIFKACTMGGP